jgi:GTPase SAR1 family protein
MLYRMKLGVVVQALPTLGFNYEKVQVGHSELLSMFFYHDTPLRQCIVFVCFLFTSLLVWDLGGQIHIRTYWRLYYTSTNGIIFVVDAADQDRFSIARQELHGVLQESELKGLPLLVFANKMDLETASPVTEISQVSFPPFPLSFSQLPILLCLLSSTFNST